MLTATGCMPEQATAQLANMPPSLIRQHAAMQRARRRAEHIPDMELGDSHLPCDWFAQVGFFRVLDYIGRAQPEMDWAAEGAHPWHHEQYLAARLRDHQRVADWLRDAAVEPLYNDRNQVDYGGLTITWPARIPQLRPWSGQQTLLTLIRTRQSAIPAEVTDIMAPEGAINGASGIDPDVATDAIDDGFSVNALNMLRVTRVCVELLAMIGVDQVPITIYPDGRLGYQAHGDQWAFRCEVRDSRYYKRWGEAARVAHDAGVQP